MARQRKDLPDRPDRISGRALASWLQANDISLHTLARELGVAYGTASNWVRGYSVTPGWLEQRIARASEVSGKLPPFGQYREREAPPLPALEEALPYDDRYDWEDD